MKERLKSLLLLFLVTLSLFLTYLLWYTRKPAEVITASEFERVFFEEPRPPEKAVTPAQILVHREEQLYRLGEGEENFRILWDAVSAALRELPHLDDPAFNPETPEAVLCLTLLFEPPLPAGGGSPWLEGGEPGELERIELRRIGERFWFTCYAAGFAPEENLALPPERGEMLARAVDLLPAAELTLYNELTGELTLESGVRVMLPGGIYVPADTWQMDELVLGKESLDEEMLLGAFFVNRSTVRLIKERDGAVIYTDGEKGLRLGRGLEYTHPQLEREQGTLSYAAALATCCRLIGYYGGWPEKLRLESLAPVQSGRQQSIAYRAAWTYYYQGWPLRGGAEAAMVFNDGGLIEYRRELYEPLHPAGDPVVVGNWREALAEAADYLHREDKIGETVLLERLTLAYRISDGAYKSRAVPVWEIRLDGIELFLTAADLLLLEEKMP